MRQDKELQDYPSQVLVENGRQVLVFTEVPLNDYFGFLRSTLGKASLEIFTLGAVQPGIEFLPTELVYPPTVIITDAKAIRIDDFASKRIQAIGIKGEYTYVAWATQNPNPNGEKNSEGQPFRDRLMTTHTIPKLKTLIPTDLRSRVTVVFDPYSQSLYRRYPRRTKKDEK